ncbi:YhcN/YlaJ family sporulation lipoprotein [Litchfieldia salsa]|uniref:Sporulation lipoprotein YhcN/YlaJ (Spore_YhcN_YlaJ) n=1 Tax=Litchfieldia salsa TaxID=930152 RepID=A0A1H0WQ93_9BACI|nr:YhcN/YlaJ family sporulation lipoprotein [Litchfieldia salsa]SDP92809.1 Sporulation lipoprotein YhcN/YlaJ (Spore_YhcN_YlaJ) [Litchfieldia salsa]
MKKSVITAGLCCLFALSGCNNDQNAELYEKSGNTINRTDRSELYNANITDENKHFGYVRHQKSPVPGSPTVYSMPTIDREVVADMISKMSTQLVPDVNEAATLVTDEEVLIVYDTDSENRFETADQVKKTALSIVPRWYHVYVSDNPRLIKDIERFGVLDATSRNVDQIITTTIERMLESPQGRKISDGENANGEMSGGVNNQYERKMNDLPENLQNPNSKTSNEQSDVTEVETDDIDEGHTESRGRTNTN